MPPRSIELAKLPEPDNDWSRRFPQVLQLEELVTNMYAERPVVDFSYWYTPTPFRTTDVYALYRKFLQSASQLTMGQDPNTREDALKEVLTPKLAGTVFSNQLETVCHDIAVVTSFCEDFVRIGATLPDEVRQYSTGDPERELSLVKKLILVGNITPKEGEIIPDLVFGQALIAVPDQREEMSVPEELLESLKSGKYDAEIARDLLEDPEVSDDPRNVPEIKQLLRYTQSLMGIPIEAIDPAIDYMLEAKNMEAWPESAKKELAIFKLGLASELQAAIARLRTLSYEESVLTPLAAAPVDREAALDRSIQAMRNNTMQQLNKGVNKLELVRALVEEKKKRRHLRGVASPEVIIEASEPEQEKRVPLKVYWLDGSDIEHPEDSDAFRRHMREYIEPQKHDVNFLTDINAVIDHLKTFDFSQPSIPGVKHYSPYKKTTCYQFSASGVKGLTKTKEASMMRVLFIRKSDKIAIIGITRKSDMRKIQKTLGLGRSQKK